MIAGLNRITNDESERVVGVPDREQIETVSGVKTMFKLGTEFIQLYVTNRNGSTGWIDVDDVDCQVGALGAASKYLAWSQTELTEATIRVANSYGAYYMLHISKDLVLENFSLSLN